MEWRQLRSRQIKYLDGNLPAKYKALSDADKVHFLDAREAAYYRLLDSGIDTPNPDLMVAPKSLQAAREELGIQLRTRRETGPEFDTAISRLIWVREDNTTAAAASPENDLVPVWNRNVDLDFLLAELVITHGLLREKYRTDQQATPSPRSTRKNLILCGKKWLSASDFLRLEMRMPWPKACEYLRQIIEKQTHYRANMNPRSGIPDLVLWRRFSNNLTRTRQELQAEVQRWIEDLSKITVDAKYQEHMRRSYERFTMFQIKMPKHVRELFLALIDNRYDERKMQMSIDVRDNRRQIKIMSIQLSNWNLYLSYLHKYASAVPACLEELRKHAPAKKIPSTKLHFRGGAEAPGVIQPQTLLDLDLKIRVAENGDVNYLYKGMPHLIDDGSHVIIEDIDSSRAIAAGLTLAGIRWGSAYTIEGPSELCKAARALAAISRPSSVNVTGQDSAHRRRLQQSAHQTSTADSAGGDRPSRGA